MNPETMTHEQIDQLTEAQLWEAVCLATRDCHCVDDGSLGKHCISCKASPCETCDGTSRVWALPGMQEKCRKCSGSGQWLVGRRWTFADAVIKEPWYAPCPICHGSGYVAKRDLGALLDISFLCLGAHAVREIVNDTVNSMHDGIKAEQALLRAVAKALVARGGACHEP